MQQFRGVAQARSGAALSGATVSVYESDGQTLATIYSGNSTATTKANPITADDDGEYSFYALDGRYTISIASPGKTTETISDVIVFDPDPRLPYSVESYGAYADGMTDDTTAIQDAIDAAYAAGGGYVELRVGVSYRIDGTLALKSGVILGNTAGMWDVYSTFASTNHPAAVRIIKHGTGNAIEFVHTGGKFAGGGLVGIALDGSNQTADGGIYLTPPTSASSFGGFIRQCIVEKAFAFGIKIPISTYSMDDFKIIDTMVEGTRSTASGEGSGYINYATDTSLRHCYAFRNARHGIESYGGTLRMINVDSFYNDECGVYDAGQATKALYLQTDANGTYGIHFDVCATYAAAGRQHTYNNVLSWKNNTSGGANGRNVKIGQTAGGAGLTNIAFTAAIFGAASGEAVEYHVAVDAAITGGQNRFTNCQFYDTTASAGVSMNDNLWKMSIFSGCGTGTEQVWRKPTTLASGTTIPSVQLVSEMVTANATPTTITNFSVGKPGQTITLMIADANTTIDFTGTNLKGNGGSDWAAPNGGSMTCTTPDGTTWYCRIS